MPKRRARPATRISSAEDFFQPGGIMANLIEIEVNGKKYPVRYDPDTPLLYVLRDELGLTGSKYGCGEGQCGACTVLIGGVPRRSCQIAVSAAAGRPITTIEGLEKDGRLHPVQQAFLDAGAFQCAYCTPGMIMSSVGFCREMQIRVPRKSCNSFKEISVVAARIRASSVRSGRQPRRCRNTGHE